MLGVLSPKIDFATTTGVEGVGSLLPLAAFNAVETPQWQKAPDTVRFARRAARQLCETF